MSFLLSFVVLVVGMAIGLIGTHFYPLSADQAWSFLGYFGLYTVGVCLAGATA